MISNLEVGQLVLDKETGNIFEITEVVSENLYLGETKVAPKFSTTINMTLPRWYAVVRNTSGIPDRNISGQIIYQ